MAANSFSSILNIVYIYKMSLSECLDHSVPIPWANMRFNDVTLDGNLLITGTGKSSTGDGLITTYTNGLVTNNTSPTTYLTIPITNTNSVYQVTIIAIAYTTVGALGAGVYSEINSVYSIVGGVLTYSVIAKPVINVPIGYGTIPGANIIPSGIELICQVQNTNAGQTTDWVILTRVISNVIP